MAENIGEMGARLLQVAAADGADPLLPQVQALHAEAELRQAEIAGLLQGSARESSTQLQERWAAAVEALGIAAAAFADADTAIKATVAGWGVTAEMRPASSPTEPAEAARNSRPEPMSQQWFNIPIADMLSRSSLSPSDALRITRALYTPGIRTLRDLWHAGREGVKDVRKMAEIQIGKLVNACKRNTLASLCRLVRIRPGTVR